MASMYRFCASPLGVIGRRRAVIEHDVVEKVAQAERRIVAQRAGRGRSRSRRAGAAFEERGRLGQETLGERDLFGSPASRIELPRGRRRRPFFAEHLEKLVVGPDSASSTAVSAISTSALTPTPEAIAASESGRIHGPCAADYYEVSPSCMHSWPTPFRARPPVRHAQVAFRRLDRVNLGLPDEVDGIRGCATSRGGKTCRI